MVKDQVVVTQKKGREKCLVENFYPSCTE